MKKSPKRKLELAVISDVHLGTYGCHAKELVAYLRSIRPKTLVLNGDIIDIWQFRKRYWPPSHMRVIRELTTLIGKGTCVYYVTGNHDEMLRRFEGFRLGSFRIVNKIVLDLEGGKRAWIFHGDVFDVSMQHARWLARLGAVGYDILILLNRLVNFFSERIFRSGKISLSKRIKDSVKSAVSFINNFEETVAGIGISKGYDYVVCGHIHQPQIREIANSEGRILYLNSGDWVENLTALEFHNGAWQLYRHSEADIAEEVAEEEEPKNTELFNRMLEEFNLLKTE